MSAELLQILADCREKTAKIEEEAQQALVQKLVPQITAEFEPLFAERQKFLDAKENFWTNIILSKNAATSSFCSDVDTKVLRALESVQVTKKVENIGTDNVNVIRTVTFRLRPSIFCQGGELTRAMNTDGNTVSVSGVSWKIPERSREGTILRVFEKETPDVEAKAIMDAVDEVFQNPEVAANVE